MDMSKSESAAFIRTSSTLGIASRLKKMLFGSQAL